ncbi:MAG: hypothetical protein KDD76_01970 [Rickettsiales bacterium]|nr:hypothetical protein [Rickettsiales bacterium]
MVIKVRELCLRDGIQFEQGVVPTDVVIQAALDFIRSGVTHLEMGSFVTEQIEGMQDTPERARRMNEHRKEERVPTDFITSYLVAPSKKEPTKHLDRALAVLNPQYDELSIFIATGDAFSEGNLRMPVAKSLEIYQKIVEKALANNFTVNAYLSGADCCPLNQGTITEALVVQRLQELLQIGVNGNLLVSSTTGLGVPKEKDRKNASLVNGGTAPLSVENLFNAIKSPRNNVPFDRIGYHPHDKDGAAIKLVQEAARQGVEIFDCSAGGLGGCTNAKKAPGNIATHDLYFAFHERQEQHKLPLVDFSIHSRAALKLFEALNLPSPFVHIQHAGQRGTGNFRG